MILSDSVACLSTDSSKYLLHFTHDLMSLDSVDVSLRLLFPDE